MSINYDCMKCERPEAETDEEAVGRKCLVFESLCVNLDTVTAENEEEWMFRSMLLQHLGQSSILYGTDDWQEKAGHLRAHLRRWRGMTTNATRKTRKQWLARTMEFLEKEILRRLPKEESDD